MKELMEAKPQITAWHLVGTQQRLEVVVGQLKSAGRPHSHHPQPLGGLALPSPKLSAGLLILKEPNRIYSFTRDPPFLLDE